MTQTTSLSAMRSKIISRKMGIALTGLLAMTACADQSGEYSNAQRAAITGALIGGVAAGTRSGDERLEKAAAGAIVGGLIGGAIGSQLDKQAAELERDLGTNGVSIVNTGSELVVTMPQDVLFATDSSTLRADLQQDLYTLAGSLNRYPDTTVNVVGHTDNTGDANYNQNLSQARANSVASVLIGAGVPRARINAYGRGEDAPIASNLSAEGRAQNRRVEFVIRPNS
ncbi:OmpA family protein [Albirhodobacter sp. R86504]|uniref:OmpA family protein n=1 Tax=Albirhodobacter sp. R86504 TaxID=3093848 RepID=UPI00366C623D